MSSLQVGDCTTTTTTISKDFKRSKKCIPSNNSSAQSRKAGQLKSSREPDDNEQNFLEPDRIQHEYEYQVFKRLADVESYITEKEMAQTTKFILNRICKGFGSESIDEKSLKKQRIKWIASGVKFMGQPFVLIGDKRYDCRHGKDKNVSKKEKYHKKRKSLMSSGEQQRINSSRRSEPIKLDCPARIQIRDILVYTEFEVRGSVADNHDLPAIKDPTESDGYVKHNAQRRLRDRTSAKIRDLVEQGAELKTERQFHVTFPKIEAHRGHHVGQAAGTSQPVDRKVIQEIKKLVSEGVIHIDEMKRRLDDFIVHLFAGQTLPDKNNRRYYPLAKDLSNHIQKAMAGLMSSSESNNYLEQLIERIKNENTSDKLYFRSNRLLYVHQTPDQQWLVNVNLNSVYSLDVKYRGKRSSKPMFLISAQTSTGCQTVATFIIQEESCENILEAIEVMKSYNSNWKPCQWIVDMVSQRAAALKSAFPNTPVTYREMEPKTLKRQPKRLFAQSNSSPTCISIGDKLKDLLRELTRLSYVIPPNAHTWNLVNNLENIVKELNQAIDCSSQTYEHVSHSDLATFKPKRVVGTSSSHTDIAHLQGIIPDHVIPGKIARHDPPVLHNGLTQMVTAVDQIARAHQQHAVTSAHTYINASHQLLSAHNLLPPHHQSIDPLRHPTLLHSSDESLATTSNTHSLMPIGNSNIPHISLMNDYHLPCSTENICSQLHERTFIELKTSESHDPLLRHASVTSST